MANSISHAALPYPIKNARFTLLVPYLDADGDPTDPTTPDTEVSQDGGAFADAAEEVTTISGTNGLGYITLTGAETNNSAVGVAFKVASGPKATLMTLFLRVLPVLETGTAQAGASGTITLASGAAAYDLTGCIVRTTGGTGGGGTGGANNQARVITAYNTSTKVATITPNWETNPSSDTTYDVLFTDLAVNSLKGNNTSFGGAAGTYASGRPETNTTHIAGSSVSTSTAQIGVNVVNFGGSAGTFASGRPEVNTSHWAGTAVGSTEVRANLINIAGAAVSTSTAQLGVNLVNVGGSATPVTNLGVVFNTDFATNYNTTLDVWNVNVENWNATAVPAEHTAGYPIVTVKDGTGTGEINTTSGRVDADITHIATAAVSTSTAQLGVNVVNFGGAAGTFASGRPEVNASHWAGAATATNDVALITAPSNFASFALDVNGHVTLADGSLITSKLGTFALAKTTNITGFNDITAAAAADAVWDESTTGHTTSGTFGEQLKTDVDAILVDTNALDTDWADGGRLDVILDARASQTTANSIETDTQDIQSRLPAALVSGRMDSNMQAAANSVITRAVLAADTGLQSIRSNTAQAGAAGTITLDASASATDNFYNDCVVYLTGGTGAGQIRHISDYDGTSKVVTIKPSWVTNPDNTSTFAVLATTSPWDHVLADHLDSGSTGEALNAAGSAGDPWGTSLPGAYSAGTAGFIVGTNIDALISSRLAPTTASRTLDVSAAGNAGIDWSNIEAPTTTVNLSGTTVKTATDVEADTQDIQSRLPAALVSGRMDSNMQAAASGVITRSVFAADTGLQTIRSNTAQAGAAGTVTLDASASASDDFYNDCAVYLTGGTGAGQVRHISDYAGSSKIATVKPNWTTTPDNTSTFSILPATSPWDHVTADHLDSGSTGSALNAAGSAGDPWSTTVPGAYGAGTAGFILGTNLDTTVSSRLAPTVASRTLDVSAAGNAGVDWSNIEAPTTTVNLSGTTVKTATDVETDTQDIQSRLPAALGANGNIKADVRDFNAVAGTFSAGRPEVNTSHWAGAATATNDVALVTAPTNFASLALDVNGHVTLADSSLITSKLGTFQLAKTTNITGFNDLSSATVTSIANTALTDIHLDHLLAADYDPASKPGTATALLNELIGNDAGVSQFTVNALELAPTGGTPPTAVQIRQEMDSNSTQLAAIVADTNELQTDWANGGRLDNILDARASQTTATSIETDTQDIQSRLPAALISGRMNATAQDMATDVITAAAVSAAAVTKIQLGLSTVTTTQVKDQVVAALDTDTYAIPGQEAPAATTTLRKMLSYLYKAFRNRSTQSTTEYKLFADDATTVDQKATVSDDTTTFDRGELGTGP